MGDGFGCLGKKSKSFFFSCRGFVDLSRGGCCGGGALAKAGEGGGGGLAFGFFFAFAGAASQFGAEVVDGAFEDAVVVGAGHGGHLVLGWVGGLGLEDFLEFAFGVVEAGDGVELAEGVGKGVEDELAGGFVAAVQEDGAQEGFVG